MRIDSTQPQILDPYISIEDNDILIFNYINNIIKPQIKTLDGLLKPVPLVYNGALRWVQTRKRKFIVDLYGNVKYPIVSFSRTSVSYHDPKHVNRIWTNVTRNFVTVENRYSKLRPFDSLDLHNANIQPRRNMVNIMIPIDITCIYDFQIYTDTWLDMNHIVLSFMLYTDRWWVLDNHRARIKVRLYMHSILMQLSLQRLIKTLFSILTLGTLLPSVYQPFEVIDDRKIIKIKVGELSK